MPKTIDLTPKKLIMIPSKEKIKLPETWKGDMAINFGGLEVGSNRLAKGQLVILPHLEQILFGLATSPTAGVGIFIGKDGADYEFRVGDPSGNNLLYDGTDIILTGGTLSAGAISGTTIIGGSIDIGDPTHYFTVGLTGVTAIRYGAAAGNLVTNSQTAVSLGGSPTSLISFDQATTDITRLSLTRLTVAATTNALVIFNDAGTTSNSAILLSLVSASTGAGINLSKTGAGTGLNIAQSGAGTGIQLTQTGLGQALRIDMDYTASTVTTFLIDNNNSGVCIAIFSNSNGPHFRFSGDPTPSSPVDGDLWFNGSELKIRIGATTYNLDKTAE